MNETYFPQIERLIATRTGLQLRSRERDALRVTLAVRMAALQMRHPEGYQELLEAGTVDAEHEWEQLTVRLTNNESYFFRDKGQMALLRDRILPELIARNQERRSLRVWSAGCATGEEAYSLAILVAELLPEHRATLGGFWEIAILGTDIDADALQAARRGIYNAWSFRTMEPAQKQQWFHRHDGGWQVAQATRSLVTFRRCNLVVDALPSTALGIYEMDLILCRNVFIYFAPTAVSVVLPKFADSLREGGYLMTGHAETLGQPVAPLVVRRFPESVVYQRASQESVRIERPFGVSDGKAIDSLTPTNGSIRTSAVEKRRREPTTLPLRSVGSATSAMTIAQMDLPDCAMVDAETMYAGGDYEGTIRRLQAAPELVGDRVQLLLAHAHANLGHAAEATAWCQRITKEFPFAAEPYELLASLAQEEGRYDDAKLLLKQALYLAPGSPTPYLELAALYERDGDRGRARKIQCAVLELLERLPAETVIGFTIGPTALEWRAHLEQCLVEGE